MFIGTLSVPIETFVFVSTRTSLMAYPLCRPFLPLSVASELVLLFNDTVALLLISK